MKLAKKWPEKQALAKVGAIMVPAGLHQDNQDYQDKQDEQDSQDGVWWVGVVEELLPNAPRQTDKLLWSLARSVKRPEVQLAEYLQIFECWHGKANPAFLNSTKDYLAEFLRKVGIVKYRKGATLLSALHAAKQAPVPPKVAAIASPTARLLASLCRELQRRAGPQNPIFVDSISVGMVLGVSHTTVSNWLGAFCGDAIRLLQKTKQGGPGKGANEYRYLCTL